MKPKSMFPLNNPQRPEDLRPEDGGQGFALSDWAGAPVNASHLVFGYTAAQNGALVLYGYVDDTRQQNPQSAQLMASRYAGSLDEAGAIHIAHEFANDIIQKFGGTGSLLGSRIYYVSQTLQGRDRNLGDGLGRRQPEATHPAQIDLDHARRSRPMVRASHSPAMPRGTPRIMMVDTMSGRALPFYNQEASLNANASFTPDGKQIYYASTASGIAQIYVANSTDRASAASPIATRSRSSRR